MRWPSSSTRRARSPASVLDGSIRSAKPPTQAVTYVAAPFGNLRELGRRDPRRRQHAGVVRGEQRQAARVLVHRMAANPELPAPDIPLLVEVECPVEVSGLLGLLKYNACEGTLARRQPVRRVVAPVVDVPGERRGEGAQGIVSHAVPVPRRRPPLS